jgi:hypothetical protein
MLALRTGDERYQRRDLVHIAEKAVPLHRPFDLRSGVDAAVDRQVRTVDERRLRTGDESLQRRDLVGGLDPPIKWVPYFGAPSMTWNGPSPCS